MIIHTEAPFTIFFGDNRTQFNPRDFKNFESGKQIVTHEPFSAMQRSLRLEQLVFLHQVHGINGTCIVSTNQAETIRPFSQEGDFLITNVPSIGLAIAAADCLPIIMYDKFRHVIAIVHAGWRGSVNGVAVAALERMKSLFGTDPATVRVFLGPSAKSCCYRVGSEVLAALEHCSYKDEVIYTMADGFYFDLPLFNRRLLEEHGIKKESCNSAYNICTIDNTSFCSYRRQEKSLGRQMTVVVLK